jgi:hypothetical protein
MAALMALQVAIQSARTASAQQSTIQTQSDQARTKQTQTDQGAEVPTDQHPNRARSDASDLNLKRFKASELVGMNVRGKSGDDEIGEISDLMIATDGTVEYAAVSFGGFLGLGDKLFAVPFEGMEFVRERGEAETVYARIDVTEDQLRNRAGFNQDRWPQVADESFLPVERRPARQAERPVTPPPSRDTNLPR